MTPTDVSRDARRLRAQRPSLRAACFPRRRLQVPPLRMPGEEDAASPARTRVVSSELTDPPLGCRGGTLRKNFGGLPQKGVRTTPRHPHRPNGLGVRPGDGSTPAERAAPEELSMVSHGVWVGSRRRAGCPLWNSSVRCSFLVCSGAFRSTVKELSAV